MLWSYSGIPHNSVVLGQSCFGGPLVTGGRQQQILALGGMENVTATCPCAGHAVWVVQVHVLSMGTLAMGQVWGGEREPTWVCMAQKPLPCPRVTQELELRQYQHPVKWF